MSFGSIHCVTIKDRVKKELSITKRRRLAGGDDPNTPLSQPDLMAGRNAIKAIVSMEIAPSEPLPSPFE